MSWGRLAVGARAALSGRLAGLYGHETDEAAFDSLAADKQHALLLFAARLGGLGLWGLVARVSNVYGEGGVGLEFEAAGDFSGALGAHERFTRRFARHGDSAEGFLETGRARAALHILRPAGPGRLWAAHFDLHSPLASPASALRHLYAEKLRGQTPDWREVRLALGGDDDEGFGEVSTG
ncbi:MAG: hypothetical protein LC800_14465 [Acidobacteria bacterium]|nr:hypothetical protein [Acidobacteriota bacterium]